MRVMMTSMKSLNVGLGLSIPAKFLCLCYLPCLLTPTLSLMTDKPFFWIPSPQYGPERLDTGWVDRSLMSCMATCMLRYPQTCQSVMYNTTTQLCTPGHWLNQSQPRPDVTEGQLYATYQCTDKENFQVYTYNQTAACLSLNKIKMNYTDAQKICQDLDSHLYTPRTLDKFHLLQSLIDDGTYWVGLNDMDQEDVFVWEDDGEQINDTLKTIIFAPREPNDRYGEDCTAVSPESGVYDKMLNDIGCEKKGYYICEKPMLMG